MISEIVPKSNEEDDNLVDSTLVFTESVVALEKHVSDLLMPYSRAEEVGTIAVHGGAGGEVTKLLIHVTEKGREKEAEMHNVLREGGVVVETEFHSS